MVVYLGSMELAEVAEVAGWDEILARVESDEVGFAVFARLVLILGAIGWLIEATVVGSITAFLRAVRPALLRAAPA